MQISRFQTAGVVIMSSLYAAYCSLMAALQEVEKMLASASKVQPGNDLFRTLGDRGESQPRTLTSKPLYSVTLKNSGMNLVFCSRLVLSE